MNLYEDIYTDIVDVFNLQKEENDNFVNPKHIGALFCYYSEFDINNEWEYYYIEFIKSLDSDKIISVGESINDIN